MTNIPKTLKLFDADLQYRVADLLKLNPFSDEVQNLTKIQMLWIIRKHNASEAEASGYEETDSFVDDDFDSKLKEATNG